MMTPPTPTPPAQATDATAIPRLPSIERCEAIWASPIPTTMKVRAMIAETLGICPIHGQRVGEDGKCHHPVGSGECGNAVLDARRPARETQEGTIDTKYPWSKAALEAAATQAGETLQHSAGRPVITEGMTYYLGPPPWLGEPSPAEKLDMGEPVAAPFDPRKPQTPAGEWRSDAPGRREPKHATPARDHLGERTEMMPVAPQPEAEAQGRTETVGEREAKRLIIQDLLDPERIYFVLVEGRHDMGRVFPPKTAEHIQHVREIVAEAIDRISAARYAEGERAGERLRAEHKVMAERLEEMEEVREMDGVLCWVSCGEPIATEEYIRSLGGTDKGKQRDDGCPCGSGVMLGECQRCGREIGRVGL
jgi:hypothetical protein